MESNIIEELKTFTSIGPNDLQQSYKFIPTLTLVSVTDILNIQNLLLKSGIEIHRCSQFRLCTIPLEELNRRLLYAKEHNLMERIVKDPNLLTNKGIFNERKSSQSEANKEEPQNDIEQILMNEQTIDLNDETFQRYQILSDCVNHIIESIDTKSLTKDSSIYDNLVKLITNNIESDREVLYNALTFNKNYPAGILTKILNAVDEVLSFINKMDENETRLAA